MRLFVNFLNDTDFVLIRCIVTAEYKFEPSIEVNSTRQEHCILSELKLPVICNYESYGYETSVV